MTHTDQQSNLTPDCPNGILHALLISFLSPMFVLGSGGDIATARLAAAQVVSGYAAADALQLFAVVQIVAFGICSLGSLALSMAEELPVSMILRLRGNAVALSRAGAWHQKVLATARQEAELASPSAAWASNDQPEAYRAPVRKTQVAAHDASVQLSARTDGAVEPGSGGQPPSSPNPPPAQVDSPAIPARPAETSDAVGWPHPGRATARQPRIDASGIATSQPVAARSAIPTATASNPPSAAVATPGDPPGVGASPGAAPGPNASDVQPAAGASAGNANHTAPATDDQLWRSAWAEAMAVVADEYTATLPGLTLEERHEAALKADVLKMTANELRADAARPATRIRP